MAEGSKKTTLYLSDELHARAKAAAAQLRIPLTTLVARAIEHELERLFPAVSHQS